MLKLLKRKDFISENKTLYKVIKTYSYKNRSYSHLNDLLWSVRGEFLEMIHVTDQEVKNVRSHQCYTLIGILWNKM